MKQGVTALTDAADGLVARAKWLHAANLGARGRYGDAAAVLASIVASPDPAIRALARTCRASHRRQLGDYAFASALDDAAYMDLLRDSGAPGDYPWHDVLVNRVADSVGMGEPQNAVRRLDEAESEVADHGAWRARVRLAWVYAEVALMHDEPALGAARLRHVVDSGLGARSVRHQIKTAMLLAVCDGLAGGGLERCDPVSLRGCLRAAEAADLMSLVWPVCVVLRQVPADVSGLPSEAVEASFQRAMHVIRGNLPVDEAGRFPIV